MKPAIPRLAITSGEPAGIGPDLCLQLTANLQAELIILGDRELFRQRAQQLGLAYHWPDYDPTQAAQAGHITLLHCPLAEPVSSGKLTSANALYVLDMLRRAATACLSNEFTAMVTAPVHKGIINEAGIGFTGHTEFLAELCDSRLAVMMLVTNEMRVALATTHLPLSRVSENISRESLTTILRILDRELRERFAIEQPRILVCGLNPHAGEGGHLGREEIDIIQPVLESLRIEGLQLEGPLAADTLFTPQYLERADAILAMYHDQGLPVLKHTGFGRAVNITLGLPIIRTSVDHGTALELAGSGKADNGSLLTAINMAITMATGNE